MSNLPIVFKEVLQLTNLGIGQQSIGFATLTMESEKYICIRETTPDENNNVVIIDTDNPSQILRKQIKADAAIMNPKEPILALKVGSLIQLISIEQKMKLKSYQMAENLEFWKWISPNILALVTPTAVYHWAKEGTSEPVKMFDRHPHLQNTQIINYRSDSTQQWLVLVAIHQVDGHVAGRIQLYSVEKSISQSIEGHAACFANYMAPGATRPSILFAISSRTPAASKVLVLEVSKGDGPNFVKKSSDVFYPPDVGANDFPVAMQISDKYEVIYMITKLGYIHLFDLSTASLIYRNRISSESIFVTSFQETTNGIVCVNRKGQVLSVSIDDNNIIPYICNVLNNYDLAISMASKNNLPGAEGLLQGQFERLFAQGQYKEAAKVAADSPGTILRNLQTIQRFQAVQAPPNGQPSPLLQYFGMLLEKGKLNKVESLELVRPVLQQGKKQFLEKWLTDDKLECSEQLGDEVRQHDRKLALSIYYRSGSSDKAIALYAEAGEYDKIIAYSKKINYTPDYMFLLTRLAPINPAGATEFAIKLVKDENGPLVDPLQVVELFSSRNLIGETSSFLFSILTENRPQDANLQTKLLELNLIHAPQTADQIMGSQKFTHYNRVRIGNLCEKAGLYQRALEHYTDLTDIKRVLTVAGSMVNQEFLVSYFGTINPEDRMECMRDFLRTNPRQYLQLVVAVAIRYTDDFTPESIIQMFENFRLFEGLYLYLTQIVVTSQSPEVHFKYIEAAAKSGQIKEVERMCRDSNYYDPEKTRDFLKEAKLSDQLPLIIVCDRYQFISDLTSYLYKNNLNKYIEVYVQKINPANTPMVVGALLDLDCQEDYLRNLIASVRNMCPADTLVEQVEKRNRLKLLLPWLEARVSESNIEPAVHNALAKVYIDSNKNPEAFLIHDQFYDSKVVGKYCEKRDPYLSFVAYKRGLCDYELIEVTNKNALFKNQARYLVERQDQDLWAYVLSDQNEYKRSLIDQVVQTALPETTNAQEVASTVQAFMDADLPNELIELLEKIVIEGKEFRTATELQNLLVLTAIRADKSRVMDYINKLENFDGSRIATVAIEGGLFEEAFFIYKKFGFNVEAIDVLLNNINSIERAYDFADRVNQIEVYSKLGSAQLRADMVKESIESFIKANEIDKYQEVITAAERANCYEELVKFLQMCRKKIKEPVIESELIYSYAKIDKLAEMEDFINSPNSAHIQVVGDRCFDAGLFEAAKILFTNISNFSRLTSCLVKLGQFQQAVDSARKANSTKTWKEVSAACIDAKEFRLAQVCGLFIIVHGDELEELIKQYEDRGYFNELISLLESGLASERAHVGMFTELATLYSKYKEEKLMEHLKLYYSRLNVPKVIKACQANQQWPELTYLYIHYDEHDNAVNTMINHSIEAWDHTLFKETIPKVAKLDLYYTAIQFYLEEQPLLINDLLTVMSPRIEHARAVNLIRSLGHLPLVKPYLVSAAEQHNVAAINEALNELYVEEEDYESLRASIDANANFGTIALAQKLEKHELLEFRRIAAYLYKKNNRWAQSVELSKKDRLYKDAIQSAADSKNPALTEELLNFFVEESNHAAFAACLYTCYDFVKPDVVLELAWRNNIINHAFPYIIQYVKEINTNVSTLMDDLKARQKKSEEEKEQQHIEATTYQPDFNNLSYGYAATGGMLALPPATGMYNQQQQQQFNTQSYNNNYNQYGGF
ncbi:clathrin heavy chain [Heterostelium album PN500]|uniref:Clathrin heavy chain n=1 Tax=Heterostelium pallidum (strain ATCC 26659 / Pp 5 / PN500) TaxID=670386 RepID=D3BNB1_HETP5|nr:clathrin heavy chain [Heterostelium album PN500]EFA76771.1 clathrin heavy chain [Heterostelium album PN500]|eukprot:XP_020428903.1 clathrin heavy chain [Heterostelium album PN500]